MPGDTSRSWSWLEAGLIPIVSAVMYASWIGPLNQWILDSVLFYPRGVHYPPWLVITLLLGGFALRHASTQRPAGGLVAMIASGLAITGACLWAFRGPWGDPSPWTSGYLRSLTDFGQGIPTSLWVLALSGLLWRQGLAMDWGEYGPFWRGFVAGVFAQVTLILIAVGSEGTLAWRMWQWPILFLISGLLGLALLAVTRTLTFESTRGARMPALNRYWLIAVGTVILAVLIGGWLAGQIISSGTIASVIGFLRAVLARVLDLLEPAILFIFMLIFRALSPLLRLFQVRQQTPQESQSFAPEPLLEPEAELAETPQWIYWLGDAFRLLLVLAIVAAVVLLIVTSWRRRRKRRPAIIAEEREYIWSRQLILDQLRRLFTRKVNGRQTSLGYIPLHGGDPRQAVRLIYQRLLIHAAAFGFPRQRKVTPLAFERALAERLPAADTALHRLTHIYLVARYGPEAPTWGEVEEATRALTEIDAALDQWEAMAPV